MLVCLCGLLSRPEAVRPLWIVRLANAMLLPSPPEMPWQQAAVVFEMRLALFRTFGRSPR